MARSRRSRIRLRPLVCAALAIPLAACQAKAGEDQVASAGTASQAAEASIQRLAITAKAGGFDPPEVRLVRGRPAVLEFTRVTDSACMKAVRMPWMKEAVALPMNEKAEISVDTSMTGVFTYACWMDMVFGEVRIQEAE